MDPHPNQHQLYVIGHCPKTNYIILSYAPFVKSLLTLVTPPRNQRQRFETEKEAFFRPARAANQRSVCSAIGENRLVRHLITLAERDVCLRDYFELVTRTGFEPMLTA